MLERLSALVRRIPLRWGIPAALALAFLLGFALRGSGDAAGPAPAAAAPKAQWYTCSMHPQVRLPDPDARCPICGMELIPVVEDEGAGGSPRTLRMSEAAKALAEVETAPVERRLVVKEVRLVGKVDYDETRIRSITAWVPGRLDRLYVDYTGVAVRKGAPMVYLYSPELLVAQQGLLEADRALKQMEEAKADAANLSMQQATVTALEQRLRLWGLTDEQVAAIRRQGEASDHMQILSPSSGIVIHKGAVEGDYVSVGTKIYQIADLSRVWVYLDAYESDMAWIRYAEEVEFEAEAYPGEIFHGRISFVDPFLDERTRTVKLRVTVENTDGRLKPGMFVRARIHARLAEGGQIVEPFLQGKWISPVHPEVVMDAPGDCPICGTPLVSAEALGYAGKEYEAPLVVPETAPLRTGKRALVYVEVPGADRPTYEGREILLGPRAQSYYLVESGLREGERVVTKGNFKIDSALQILARPSMMSPPEGEEAAPARELPPAFLETLNPLYHACLKAQRALAADDADGARAALAEAAAAVDDVAMTLLAGRAHEEWMRLRAELVRHARAGAAAPDLETVRAAFQPLSAAILEVVGGFGQSTGASLYEAYCPMALANRGAAWLADEKRILNPYYGARMLDCGEVRRTFPSAGAAPPVQREFVEALTPVYDALLATQRALAGDDLAAARAQAALAARALDGVAPAPQDAWLADAWAGLRARGVEAAERVAGAADLAAARAAFEPLTGTGLALIRRFGHAGTDLLVEAFCPMAFDQRGASWLQAGEKIANPWFGAEMPDCGQVTARFPPARVAEIPAAMREGLSRSVEAYLKVGAALGADDLESALAGVESFESSLAAVPAAGLGAAAAAGWRKEAANLRSTAETLRKAADLEAARRPFALLSDSLARVLRRFGHAGPDDLVLVHCPMAFQNRGADWIQRGEEIRNPYFGGAMLGCGDVRERLPARPKD